MSVDDAGPLCPPALRGPHSWDMAARCLPTPDYPLMKWLRNSDLPGTEAATEDSWPVPARESFLRLLCGDEP
jgi:hypothetical protein